MIDRPLILDPNGKIAHLLRQQRRLDWMADAQAWQHAAGGGSVMQLVQHIWKKACRDRILSRAEKGLEQNAEDMVLVLGDELMDLSGAERDELYGPRRDGAPRYPARDRSDQRFVPREHTPREHAPREHAPREPDQRVSPSRTPPGERRSDAAAASGAEMPAEARDLEAWLDASTHAVLQAMRTPLLRDPEARQPLAYEATAIAWATIQLAGEGLLLDDLPPAVQRWITSDLAARQQPDGATADQRARTLLVDRLYATVGMSHARDAATSRENEGDTVRRMWRHERGETESSAAPAAGPLRDADDLPPEPEPGFLSDAMPGLSEPAVQTPSASEGAHESAAAQPTASPSRAAQRVTPGTRATRVAPVPTTRARIWAQDEPEPYEGRLIASGADWVRILDDQSGKIERVRSLHRHGGPAIEDLEGTGLHRYFLNGVETPVNMPPGLRADAPFLAHWMPRWEAAGRPEDAWHLCAETLREAYDPDARLALMTRLSQSADAGDRVFTEAVQSGFGDRAADVTGERTEGT
ncbi:MAG: hypothetical protein H3C62_05220 [Gemmatimonadaceae bacterium]|nr:hypothetical protein [Gemmatimonadaceae bacterium]